MNKYGLILIWVLFSNYLIAEAQTDNYSLSFSGNYDVEVKRGHSQWTKQDLLLPLEGQDSLHVIRGIVSLIKNKKESKPIPPILKTSVINAWNEKYTKSSTYPLSVWGTPMGSEPSINFAFVNHLGDSITTVQNGDTIKAMTLSHSSDSTLYAYIYWAFPCDSDYIKMSDYLLDSVCIVKPKINNEFFLLEPMTITRNKNSIIFICISENMKEEPLLYNVNSLDELTDKLRKNGLFIYFIDIKFNAQQ